MKAIPTYFLLLLALSLGCQSTQTNQQRAIAPPLPTPSPMGPGQVPPPTDTVAPPPGMQPAPGQAPNNIPLPPGGTGAVVPNTPEQARVQMTVSRIYSSNRWLSTRPRWIVVEGDGPGIITQNDSTVNINGNLVRSASDGQLAAVICMQLGDLMTYEQHLRKRAARQGRDTSPPPDYYQQRDGMSSTQGALEIGEVVKQRSDPRYDRRFEMDPPGYDSPTCARQALVNAGYSEMELTNAQPLVQRYPLIRR
jgi:hypothetical protein